MIKIIKSSKSSKIKISKNEWKKIGKKAGWIESPTEAYNVGDSVKLKENALKEHSRSVPPHAGFTTEQFQWRDTLKSLQNEVGTIEKIFPNSKHVNVRFNDKLIGIDSHQLEKI